MHFLNVIKGDIKKISRISANGAQCGSCLNVLCICVPRVLGMTGSARCSSLPKDHKDDHPLIKTEVADAGTSTYI